MLYEKSRSRSNKIYKDNSVIFQIDVAALQWCLRHLELMQILTNRDKGCQVLTYFISIGQNVSQHLTYFICIGWNVCQNLHKLVNQRSLGVLK